MQRRGGHPGQIGSQDALSVVDRTEQDTANPGTFLRALALAAEKHRDRQRKGAEAEVTDEATLLAAILHDTVEDTQTTVAELDGQFGVEVSGLVPKVTDDKGQPAAVRRALQGTHAASLSPEAKPIKLADKICNLRDLVQHPPVRWPAVRRRDYVEWTARVAARCRWASPSLGQLGPPPVPGGVPEACGPKALPSDPGVGYNPPGLQVGGPVPPSVPGEPARGVAKAGSAGAAG